MPGAYSQIYIQYVFAVKGRHCLLQPSWRNDLFRYIAGIVKGKNQKPIIINGVEDHVHVLVGIRPSMSISDLLRDIKNNSTRFVNDNRLVPGLFSWQEGYGAFSYAHRDLPVLFNYIQKQEEHHRVRSFREEYLDMLAEFEVEHDTKFLFDWLDSSE